MHDVHTHAELKLRDEIVKALVEESHPLPYDADETRDEEVDSPTKYEYTKKKLHRIKRRLFLDAVNSTHAQSTGNDECKSGSLKTRGRE